MRAARKLLVVSVLALAAGGGALAYGESTELARVRSLKEGANDATEVGLDMVKPELEGKLVHVAGSLEAHDPLRDDNLGIAVPGLRLHRTVEMFQWEEHEEEVAQAGTNDKQKVKSYVKKWSPDLIPSRKFEPGHENPAEPPFVERVLTAERASIGPYLLNTEGISLLSNFEPLTPTQEMLDHAPRDVKSRLKLAGQSLYLGRDPGMPEIGDCRIAFQLVKPQAVSVLAEQHGSELVSHKTRAGGKVFVVQPGNGSAQSLLEAADLGTSVNTWMARAAALVLAGFAFTTWLAIFAAGARSAPRVGRYVMPGLALLGTSIAAVTAGVAVGSAWINERPIVGGVAFGVAAAGLLAAIALVVRGRRAAATRAGVESQIERGVAL